MRIALDTPMACQAELERCATGLAELTQELTRVLEAQAEVKDQYERVEAIVARAIREEADAKLTATEVRARLTELITEDAELARVREAVFSLDAEQESLERRIRTLEKRMSGAQSALNGHLAESKATGYAPATNYGGR